MDYIADLDFSRCYRAYNTVHEMMEDRECYPRKKKQTPEKYVSKCLGLLADCEDPFEFSDQLALLFDCGDPVETTMIYFYFLESKLRKVDMEYIDRLTKKKDAERIIIVASEPVTARVSSVLNVLGDRAEAFFVDELTINITRHALVPEHILLTEEEQQEVCNYYSSDINKFPAIFTTDPMVRYYNFRVGSMIKIMRPHKGKTVPYYRVVSLPTTKKK